MVKAINNKRTIILALIDLVLRFLYYVYNALSFRWIYKKNKYSIKKILIINSGYLGDSILNIPMIKSIKKKYKKAKITLLINPKFLDIWKDFKGVDEVITYDFPWIRYKYGLKIKDLIDYWRFIKKIRNKRFDMALDSRGDLRNNWLILYNSRAWKRIGFGLTGGSYFLTDKVKWKYQHEVKNSLEIAKYLKCDIEEKTPKLEIKDRYQLPKGQNIVIAPGAGYPTKEWSIEKWSGLINALTNQENINIFLTGSPNDSKYEKIVKLIKNKKKITNLIGKITLSKTTSLIKQADLLISPDSGSMHIAAAVGTKTITLVGPTDPIRWRAYGLKENHIIIKKKINCSPCGQFYNCKYNKKCMSLIRIEDVIKMVNELI